MKIKRRQQVWIHTHFITDCTFLPEHYARDIRRKMEALLDELGIVFGIHFAPADEGVLSIVLECVPFTHILEKIEARLADFIKDIPAQPRKTQVHVEEPSRKSLAGRR
ncbi:MAG: hypothetical protein JXA57_04065 [Armatimonadetes bacterium]|nr:hypothetical protein [Armatimonadota bacterium]